MPTPRSTRRGEAAALAQALTPTLGGLLALAELMGRQSLSPAARDQLDGILRAGRQMARLVDDMSGDAPAAEAAPVALREALDAAEAAVAGRGGEAGAELLLCAPLAPDLFVAADAGGLARLFELLLATGRAAARGAVVEAQIAVEVAGGATRVSGRLAPLAHLAPDDRLRLRRAVETAAAFGADLEVEAPSAAAPELAFRLELRTAAPAALPPAEEEPPLPGSAHLLIVDDNATNRMVASALCSMFGCTAETAEDGVEAVEAASARPFDLILMDIKMPRMDGVAATRAIRALKGAAGRTPIVALTAAADPQTVAACLEAGMESVVDKPIKPAQLLAAIQEALGAPLAETRRAPAA